MKKGEKMNSVIVTGDSRGLGLTICNVLLNSGDYFIVGLSRKKTDNIQIFEEQFPDNYVHFDFDLSKPNEIQDFYHWIDQYLAESYMSLFNIGLFKK